MESRSDNLEIEKLTMTIDQFIVGIRWMFSGGMVILLEGGYL